MRRLESSHAKRFRVRTRKSRVPRFRHHSRTSLPSHTTAIFVLSFTEQEAKQLPSPPACKLMYKLKTWLWFSGDSYCYRWYAESEYVSKWTVKLLESASSNAPGLPRRLSVADTANDGKLKSNKLGRWSDNAYRNEDLSASVYTMFVWLNARRSLHMHFCLKSSYFRISGLARSREYSLHVPIVCQQNRKTKFR
jgi:hypothetical protein